MPGRVVLMSILALAVLTAMGCMKVGPEYRSPKPAMPAAWSGVPDPALVREEAVVRAWWEVFEDPILTRLVEESARGNLDLRTAVARVKEARAGIGVVTGEFLPQVDGVGRVARQRTSDNVQPGFGGTETFYSAGLDSSWELDLFGRIGRSVEAAQAAYQASEEDRRDVLVTLTAEVARNYLTFRSLQARLEAALANIESQRRVLGLTRARLQYGLATELDVAQAEDVLANSEAQVPPLRSGLVEAASNLSVLLGRTPGSLMPLLEDVKPIPAPPPEVLVGLPSELLRRRPDIRRAERELAVQTARIGIAAADLYPRFSLLGTFGLESVTSGDFLESGSRFFGIGPSVRWNLFSGGRVRSRIQVEDARAEQALLQYEQAVLSALGEVETAMAAYREERYRVEALERSAAASRRTLELAVRLYVDGLRDFQAVLDAERTLFDVENRVAEARGDMAVRLVQLYKALGGGWDVGETGTGAL